MVTGLWVILLGGFIGPLWAVEDEGLSVIRIGVENNSPPLSFRVAEGKAQGFTPELLNAMEQTGLVRFEIVAGSWSSILKNYGEGKLDALANVIETDERRKTMSYSIPHASMHGVAYTRPGDPVITHTAQFAGKSMAMLNGTMSYLNAVKNKGWGAQIVGFDKWQEVLSAVKEKRCDFALLTRPLKFEQPDEMGLNREFVDDVNHRFHMVVQPGYARKREQINAALAEVLRNGEFDRLFAKWIGPIEPHPIRWNDLRPHLPGIISVIVVLLGVFVNNQRINRRLRKQATDLQTSIAQQRRQAELLELTGRLAKIGGWEVEVATNRVSWTEEVFRILGMETDQPLRVEETLSLYSAESKPIVSKAVEVAIETGKPYDLQLSMKTVQGEDLWVHTQGFTEMRDGKTIRLYGTFQDITHRREVEIELASIHDRFMELVDSTDGIVWEADAETLNFNFVSSNAERMLGYPVRDWMEPRFWQKHLHPEDRDWAMAYCVEHTRRGEGHIFEYRFYAADGRVLWMRDQVVVLTENGVPKIVRGLMVDITVAREIQNALEQREAQFRSIFEGSPIGIAMFDSRRKKMLRVNPQFAEIAGRSEGELLALDWMTFAQPEELPFDFDLANQIQAGEISTGQIDKCFRRPDGSEVWINVTTASTASDDQAYPYYLVMIKDITQRKQAELGLHESEERFRRAVLHSPIPIMIHAEDGTVVQVSDSWCKISGYSAAELSTIEAWLKKACGDRVASVQADIDGIYGLTKSRAEGDYTILTKEGQLRIWDIYSASLGKLPDERRLAINMAIDVTERRAAESELQGSLREKEALLKEVHHRVKNNLQVIMSLLRLETNKQTSVEAKTVLKEMQGRIRSMALLHEALYRTGNYARVNLGGYLRQLSTELFRGHNSAPDRVRLEMHLSEVFVTIDQAIPCGLIVNELLTNALKHGFPGTHAGEVILTVAAADAEFVSLVVEDGGVGLPAGFEIGQTDSLGLQLVSDLTRQLQGALRIGSGARFEIRFKTADPHSDRGASRPPFSP